MRASLQRLALPAYAAAITTMVKVSSAFAQNFSGTNGTDGATFAGSIPAIPGTADPGDESQLREMILALLTAVLNFLALIAVIVVVIAGIRLIISQGEDEQKDKAKKTILYALVGLIIVLFARVIVGLVTEYLSDQVESNN
jgi:hypothetical protein